MSALTLAHEFPGSITQNSQKAETTHWVSGPSSGKWREEMGHLRTVEHDWPERGGMTWNSVDGPQKHHAQGKRPVAKDHTVCDSINIKRPEQANPYRQEVCGCPGLGVDAEMGSDCQGHGASVWGRKMFSSGLW